MARLKTATQLGNSVSPNWVKWWPYRYDLPNIFDVGEINQIHFLPNWVVLDNNFFGHILTIGIFLPTLHCWHKYP